MYVQCASKTNCSCTSRWERDRHFIWRAQGASLPERTKAIRHSSSKPWEPVLHSSLTRLPHQRQWRRQPKAHVQLEPRNRAMCQRQGSRDSKLNKWVLSLKLQESKSAWSQQAGTETEEEGAKAKERGHLFSQGISIRNLLQPPLQPKAFSYTGHIC